MVGKRAIVFALVLAWAAVFVWSFLVSSGIDGPRNIDTGLKRLDVLAQYQLFAVSLAIISAVLGIVWRKEAARILLVGLVPLSVTALLIAIIIVTAMFMGNRSVPQTAGKPTVPAAPAADLPTVTQD